MIWIWLLTRNRASWSTGAQDRYFTFLCAHCALSIAAMVRTFGFGNGANQWAAERAAQASADAGAFRAVSAAGCPHCGQLQPTVLDGFRRAEAKVASRGKLRLPIAAIAALVMAIVLAIPALSDIRHSSMLSVLAVSAAAAVFALFFAIFSSRVATPSTIPSGVWFSREPSHGPASWFPAQPGQAPLVVQPNQTSRTLSLLMMGVTAVTAIVALILWSETFRKVYVVSAEGSRGDLVIRLDGVEAGRVAKASAGYHDAPYTEIEVRTSSTHSLVVTDEAGHESTYELDPSTAKNGWVVAPRGRERGMCLASITTYYGTEPKDGDDKVLNTESDIVALPKSFGSILSPSPATVQTNGSETRTALRAFDCEGLDGEKLVPWNQTRH